MPIDTDHRPRLSLCLATYNRARYLDRYLTHHLEAFEAAGVDYELVVSDNCSTDETPDILARYAARYPRMRVSRQPRNVGAYPNILATLHQARGEFVVSIADDDLAIPAQLLAYVQRMADDPKLVMIQAPWALMDEGKGNEIVGKFYDFEGEHRFQAGQYLHCFAFILEHHVFPECWIIRKDALSGIVGPAPRFVFSFFWMLAHALARGDVLFSPEPHLAATRATKGGGAHVGNAEAMEGWDVYRGGLEMLVSYARQTTPELMPESGVIASAIQEFVNERIFVAARLHAHADAWSNAYQLLRRLHAYGATPDIGYAPNEVAVLAAIEASVVECAQLGAEVVVLSDDIPGNVVERMKVDGPRLVRAAEVAPEDGRRAYCSIGGAAADGLREGDFAFDLNRAMDRFPTFPSAPA